MVDPTTVLTSVLSTVAVLGAAWITSRVAGRASRRDSMLTWAQQLRDSETAAREEAQAARREAQESRERAERIKEEADNDVKAIRSEMTGLQAQVQQAREALARMTDKMTMVASEVWRPEPDIPALRRLVGRPNSQGVNGHPL
ncbi:hypothetical protein ACIBJE_02020 [Micromonospora sp. NPDC050187]|uniref:hypothetical protein n=1 Tax=Micromonospora sp. NPDC050187 TaxID=3364277 RepID=UPI00379622CE